MNAHALMASSQPNAQEAAIRIDLAAAYRLVALFGWDDLVFTHISARVPGPEHHFLINPFGWMFEEITASSLVKVDLNGQVVGESRQMVNPAGFTIHSAVHDARADAGCVMHLHTVAGTAVSSQEAGLLPLNQTAMLLNGNVAYHDFEGVALNHDERPRLVADLGGKNAMILRNHGTLVAGASVAEAFTTMYFLERACQMQVAAQAGGPLRIPQEHVQDVVEGQASGLSGVANTLVWPGLLRRLDRLNPGYAA
ncbi:class II aldolase/adducin family protein [Caulobacter segnis]|uniref:Class II aldolase/adducin family protein n=2 Tax=Caulobacter segnis TaxID=88688 RepID=D5VLQ1_CAUST|nr:class II aldolase/adducin family protein [Caulobacter segnis]ADG11424.1 class II aldolase/adducin family protein [Caulobacter segnis ATCC 21756]AVQ03091.1 class II aldolase/adducin family protein [Caulobacter segnis]